MRKRFSSRLDYENVKQTIKHINKEFRQQQKL